LTGLGPRLSLAFPDRPDKVAPSVERAERATRGLRRVRRVARYWAWRQGRATGAVRRGRARRPVAGDGGRPRSGVRARFGPPRIQTPRLIWSAWTSTRRGCPARAGTREGREMEGLLGAAATVPSGRRTDPGAAVAAGRMAECYGCGNADCIAWGRVPLLLLQRWRASARATSCSRRVRWEDREILAEPGWVGHEPKNARC